MRSILKSKAGESALPKLSIHLLYLVQAVFLVLTIVFHSSRNSFTPTCFAATANLFHMESLLSEATYCSQVYYSQARQPASPAAVQLSAASFEASPVDAAD